MDEILKLIMRGLTSFSTIEMCERFVGYITFLLIS